MARLKLFFGNRTASGATVHNKTCAASASAQALLSRAVSATKSAAMSASALIQRVAQKDFGVAMLVSRPASDYFVSSWTASSGVSLFACVDDAYLDDSDYITANVNAAKCVFVMSAIEDPVSHAGHYFNVRAWAPGGVGYLSYNVYGSVAQYLALDTPITSGSFTLTATPTNFSRLIGVSMAGFITDYTDIVVELVDFGSNEIRVSNASFTVVNKATPATPLKVVQKPTQRFVAARPVSDVSVGDFVASGGGPLYAAVDDVVPDDGDYIYNPTNTFVFAELMLSAITDPGIDTGHHVVARAWAASGAPYFFLYLQQGATVIASVVLPVNNTSPGEYVIELSPSEAAAITDYSNLRVLVMATSGSINISRVEFGVLDGIDVKASALVYKKSNKVLSAAASAAVAIYRLFGRLASIVSASSATLDRQTLSGLQYKALSAISSATASFARNVSAIKSVASSVAAYAVKRVSMARSYSSTSFSTVLKATPQAVSAVASSVSSMFRTATQSRLLSAASSSAASTVRAIGSIKFVSVTGAAVRNVVVSRGLSAYSSVSVLLLKLRPRIVSTVSSMVATVGTSVFTIEQQIRNVIEVVALFSTDISRSATFTLQKAVNSIFSKSVNKDAGF